ncbi:hypothetical protein [Rheinheimera soli]|uniref:hypothetical protein n=1 Tax=Rheinheimera soli TaxID=443616 RepID=UPI001E5C4EEA|nr:hypothetical protein [Rheinheimera soli]
MNLFEPLVENAKLHKNFRSIMKESKALERAELQRWAEGFPDRDGKFIREFQTSFNSCFWEIYLYALFREFGFEFNWDSASPDFQILSDKMDLIVEATTANNSRGKTAEWEYSRSADDLQNMRFGEMNRESIIRLSNSFISKADLYKRKYSQLEHVKRKPFILAIAPFEQPNFNLQYNRPIVALLYDYYVDEDAYLDNPHKYPDGPPSRSLGFVEKDNGAEIELGFFTNGGFPEISAVIFSCTATWGKVDAMTENPNVKRIISTVWGNGPNGVPEKRVSDAKDYSETLQDGLQIYHNPYARHPLDPHTFRKRGVVQVFANPVTKELMWEGEENCLMYRMTNNLSFGQNER